MGRGAAGRTREGVRLEVGSGPGLDDDDEDDDDHDDARQ